MKTWFLDFWREREEVLKRTNQLRLRPPQLKLLLGDASVRAELQNARLASLLPPVGTEIFRRFTPASLQDVQQCREDKVSKHQKRTKTEVELHERTLESWKPLPFIYGDPPPELLNCPLEELDPFYQSQKTFIVLSKGNVLHRFNAESSCFLLSPSSCLRTFAIRILVHSLFRLFIMLTILTNCAFMMSDRPTWIRTSEFVFSAVYVFEVIIKITSRGFCVGSFTFLRDPWNWLDMMVIITAFLPESLDLWTGGVLRTGVLRTVPRALKIIPVYPGVKSAAGAVVQSVKRLAGVIITTVLVLSILAVIGQHMFMESLKHKCVLRWSHLATSNGTYDYIMSYHDNTTESSDFDYDKYINSRENHFFPPGHSAPVQCGNKSGSGTCPSSYICLRTSTNPDYGLTNFDWFGSSLLNLFRLMTHDTWDYLLEQMTLSEGQTCGIFVLLVFFVAFCLLSLVLAEVTMALVEQEKVGVTEARRTEEELLHILDVMKKREETEEEEEPHHEQRLSPPCCLSVWTWNCCGCWRWLKLRFSRFVLNPLFDLVIVICLILNCVFMAMLHYPMTTTFADMFSITSLVFTVIFTVEMLLRLVAMNPYGYFQVGWNIFDSIIVVLSLVKLGLDVHSAPMACVHLMRVLRLARWWPTFHMFMKMILTSVWALRNLTLLLLTAVFIFTVVGVQLFQDDYSNYVCRIAEDCELPRWHMNDCFHTFLLIFRVLCGDWIQSMWDCMEVSSPSVCLVFFLMVLVIGHLLVLNVFLVLLLSSVGHDLVAPKEKVKNNPMIAIDQIKTVVARTWIMERIWILVGKKKPIIPHHKVVNSKETNKESLGVTSVTSDRSESEALGSNHNSKHTFQKVPVAEVELDILETEEEKLKDEEKATPRKNTPEDFCCDSCYRCCLFLDIDTSKGSGRVWSNFRRVCFSIAQHKYFDAFIIFIIVLSSAALVLEDVHRQQRQLLQVLLDVADQVFTFIFFLEMLLKWMALGFRKYFTSAWCWLDFLILAVSLMSSTLGMLGYYELGAGLSLRTVRALRPLRALSRFQGTRRVLSTLAATLPSTCDAMLVCLLVWLVFSIVGVNLFSGKFHYCLNETTEQLFSSEEVNNKSECFFLIDQNISNVGWKHAKLHYDNVAAGYLSLLQVATFNGWLDVMSSAVDATQVESQPVFESNVYMYVYFISFIIIGCFFTSNLFIRHFIHSLDQLRHKFGGKHFFMTDEQQNFSITVKKLSPRKRPSIPRPQNQCQARLFDLVTKQSFEVVMVMVICLNTVTLMVETGDQSMEKEMVLYWVEFFIIIIFFTEFLMKVTALRLNYFCDRFNVLDFMVIFLSVIGLFISDLMEKYFVSNISLKILGLLRLGRITRIIHLVPCTRRIRRLFLAFVMSLPVLFNICLLLFLLMFIFSVFGMLSFGHVRETVIYDNVFNFDTFLNSMICMFTITTMAGWGGVMSPILNTSPDCDPDTPVRGDCVHPTVGIVFFSSYITLSFLLVVLLHVAVVLETLNMNDTETPSEEDLQMEKNFTIDNLSKTSHEPISSTLQRKHEEVAATVIQNAYRKHLLKDRGADEMRAESPGGTAAV